MMKVAGSFESFLLLVSCLGLLLLLVGSVSFLVELASFRLGDSFRGVATRIVPGALLSIAGRIGRSEEQRSKVAAS